MAEFGASSESKVSKRDTPTFVIQLLTTFKFLLLKNFMLGQRDRPSSFSTCDIHTRVHHSRYNLRIAIFSVIVGWLTPDIYLLPPSFPNSVYLYSPQTSLSKLSNISRHLPMPPSQRCVQGCVGCIINHSLHGSHRPLRRSSRAPLLARPSIAIRAYRHIEPDHHSNSLQSFFVVRKALSHCDLSPLPCADSASLLDVVKTKHSVWASLSLMSRQLVLGILIFLGEDKEEEWETLSLRKGAKPLVDAASFESSLKEPASQSSACLRHFRICSRSH